MESSTSVKDKIKLFVKLVDIGGKYIKKYG